MTAENYGEIELNSLKYKIKGGVTGGWIDPFPDQMTLGDADYANRKDLSSWIINDLRGGIGVEEMDEKVDVNKCYWTNCIIKFRNHILPPRLATSLVPDDTQPTVVNANMETAATGWTGGVQIDTPAPHGGTYSWRITSAVGEGYQDISGYLAGREYTFTCWVYADATAVAKIGLNDGVTTTYSSTSTAASWVQLTVTITLAENATRLRLLLNSTTATSYFDDAALSLNAFGTAIMANFNGNLYVAFGKTIWKLNAGRTAFTIVKTLSATITAMIPSLNSRLYIYLGDSTDSYYMSTAEVFTATATDIDGLTTDAGTDTDTIVDAALSGKSILKGDYVYNTTRSAGAVVESYTNATTTIELQSTIASQTNGDTYSVYRGGTWGFQHDAKLFRVTSAGVVTYSTNPDNATPTWTSGGAITDIADQIEGFVVGRDASGSYVPYAATNSILKAYDDTTPQWIDTEARLPNHPIGGKGNAYWNGKLYLSYGLGVKEYYPETGAFIDIGLTERDGLPVEYNGEIVKLYGDAGIKGMFAAVDASVTSGNSKSGLYLYDGFGWQCWWIDTANDGAMSDIIVSSASSGYAVYWSVGTKVYYIDIPRGIENPDKITQYYATAGTLITPWFDAGNPVASKLAKLLTDYAKGITTTETVALKYRLDHTYTDLDAGWTTMDTLNTTGETGYNEELFASGAGSSYKAIQFRLDFVTAGSTAKADIQSLVFYFKKRTGAEKIRVWNVTVICDDYDPGNITTNATAKQKVGNLKSAIESATDVLFTYHPNEASTESYYVTVDGTFNEQTGREYQANYQLTLTES